MRRRAKDRKSQGGRYRDSKREKVDEITRIFID